jgi:hypothetical protein
LCLLYRIVACADLIPLDRVVVRACFNARLRPGGLMLASAIRILKAGKNPVPGVAGAGEYNGPVHGPRTYATPRRFVPTSLPTS